MQQAARHTDSVMRQEVAEEPQVAFHILQTDRWWEELEEQVVQGPLHLRERHTGSRRPEDVLERKAAAAYRIHQERPAEQVGHRTGSAKDVVVRTGRRHLRQLVAFASVVLHKDWAKPEGLQGAQQLEEAHHRPQTDRSSLGPVQPEGPVLEACRKLHYRTDPSLGQWRRRAEQPEELGQGSLVDIPRAFRGFHTLMGHVVVPFVGEEEAADRTVLVGVVVRTARSSCLPWQAAADVEGAAAEGAAVRTYQELPWPWGERS